MIGLRTKLSVLALGIKDSNPGYPYLMRYAQSNHVPQEWLVEICIQRLFLQSIFYDVPLYPEEKILLGIMDPIRIFVKNEPHTQAKRDAGRVRLIHSVSVADNLLLRLVYHDQNKREIANWWRIPSCPGIGFDDAHIAQFISGLGEGPYGHSDMSGWDFSVQMWEIELSFMFGSLQEYGGQRPVSPFVAALWCQLRNTAESVFLMGDGDLIAQTALGIRKSGAYNTASSNSKERNFVHRLSGGKWSKTVGDDLTGDVVPDAIARAKALGHTMRDYQISHGGFHFCSAEWNTSSSSLVHDIAKPLFNYVTSPTRSYIETQQFLDFIKGHPNENQVRTLLPREWQGSGNVFEEELEETDPEGSPVKFKE